MKLLTNDIRAELIANGRIQEPLRGTEQEIDFRPLVKLFDPCGAGTWLLTEIDPADEDIAFGLCDLGVGCPEIGSVSLSELASIRGRLGLGIERDLSFKADKTLLEYARDAWASGNIRHDRKDRNCNQPNCSNRSKGWTAVVDPPPASGRSAMPSIKVI